MKRHSVLNLAAVAGFAASLLAPGEQVFARENPLLDGDFWKAATVEKVAATISAGADVNARGRRGITPLHVAAHFSGSPEVVRLLLAKGGDVNAQTAKSTPLHFAAEYNDNPEMVRALLDNGADVHAQTALGFTPLHLAAMGQNNPEVVRILIVKGADANARTQSGDTPLDLVKHNDNPEVARVLLGEGAAVNARTPSGNASPDRTQRNDNSEARVSRNVNRSRVRENPLLMEGFWATATVGDVITAVREGADLHARDKEYGGTPLHWAAWWHNDPEVARQLIIRGADIHAQDSELGDTPLHWAAAFNINPGVVALLLDRGADVHVRNRSGWTPLHQAAALNENPVVVALMLDRGADAATRDKFGKTPFDYVLDNEHLLNSNVHRRLEELQYANVRENPRTTKRQARARNCHYSEPPSHKGSCAFLNYAYEGYDTESMQAWQAEDMIAAGADVNARELSSRGHIYDTPLHIFSTYKNADVVAVLLEHGADVNFRTWKEETPLHSTLYFPGHANVSDEAYEYIVNAMYEIIVLLLHAGAEVNVRDEDGNTPLSMAYELGHEPIYNILKRNGAK